MSYTEKVKTMLNVYIEKTCSARKMTRILMSEIGLGKSNSKDIAQGVGITAMMRQLDGAFGVAILSTYLTVKQAGHRNDMLAYLAEGSSGLTERLNGIIAGLISRGVNSSEAAKMA